MLKLTELSYEKVILKDSLFLDKRKTNRKYLMKLNSEKLLFNHKLEAGLHADLEDDDKIHGGWESPQCQLRGHFLGHWLSAAAITFAATGDSELKAKADAIVTQLAVCQQENGGEWAGSIPEKYLEWIAKGKPIWAPHYTVHKTFMGLLDMYRLADNQKALSVAINWSKWFHRWSGKFTRYEFDNILDAETGGMLEIWAELYSITNSSEHKELMDRYYRGRLFDALLEGKDVLTNMHANTTIPEIMGAAKAYEVTGEQKWLDICRAYWDSAVTQRGEYCTGGQTCGEIWTPKHKMSARLGEKNQEHCTVYNMMRLAEFLLRITGEAKYADYWERNLYNGILAQGYWKGRFTHGHKSEHPDTGLLTYFLPLRAGSKKAWSTETEDFFCCHGSLVQANASHNRGIYYSNEEGIVICQYISSEGTFKIKDTDVTVSQNIDTLAGSYHDSSTSPGLQAVTEVTSKYQDRPDKMAIRYKVTTEQPVEFAISIRVPWWIKAEGTIMVNGEKQNIKMQPSTFVTIKREWHNDDIYVELPRGLSTCSLPDREDVVAFLDGPVVLAGLCDEERMLYGDKDEPESILIPDNERQWSEWMIGYRTYNQDRGFRFIPLYTVGYEPYTVYFQVKHQ